MPTIAIQLDPAQLAHPDLDIRYQLPDLISERTSGRVVDDGYDYVGDEASPCLMLFLRTDDADTVSEVVGILKTERVLDNDLSGVPVAIENRGSVRVVHPPDFAGIFHWSGGS